MIRDRRILTRALALAFAAILLTSAAAWSAPRAKHVFVVSLDGAGPPYLKQSNMPNVFGFVRDGAHSYHARTTIPSVTLISHASMITGVGPEKHGVKWNSHSPEKGVVSVPTMFSEAKKSKLSTAMFSSKSKFAHFYIPGSLDCMVIPSGDPATAAEMTATHIRRFKANLYLIHFGEPDAVGHGHGWGSPEQKASLARCDEAIGVIIKAIRDARIAGESVIIVTADHGGHDKTHGGLSDRDMEIPWIAWGAGVKKGFEITNAVTTYDTAATALWLLDVPIPNEWDGKPVTSAFN